MGDYTPSPLFWTQLQDSIRSTSHLECAHTLKIFTLEIYLCASHLVYGCGAHHWGAVYVGLDSGVGIEERLSGHKGLV